ncbi:MAG: PAS domain-containing protein [Desulfotignum sp.]|jgi:PAS domain S-box-containing protein|nr:PAS domain-containing protein [Desulfotignum sp.]
MRLRLIILILAVFAFLSASTGGWLYYYSYRKAVFQNAETQSAAQLKLLTDQLSTYLSEHIKPIKALAQMRELEQALLNQNLETIFQANQILDLFTRSLELDVCYLMDRNGVTICSSNRNQHDSFVGHDFSFRPYFKTAIQGQPATYLALGTTSMKRGVYYSHPVHDQAGQNILGVAVIKSSIEFIETTLFSASEHILLFVDPDGVIFISSQPALRFKLLWDMNEEKLEALANSRQFGIGPWEWSGFQRASKETVTGPEGNSFLYTSLPVANYPDWQVVFLRNKKTLEKQVSQPFIRGIGPAVICISALAGILVFFLYQQAVKEIAQRKEAEKKLRMSEERYRDIYHKTPIMLHSIDTQGRIIRVSDHWVEVMGFARKEVIGRHLTDFFTTESKNYALSTIFPHFFETGFFKDVPYTYIKKNGGKIDILLSCYGVRDETGQVVRSLAVSVDVTEKNRTQKDLEIAKEKLSRYSQDLEKQVSRRTAQLEKAQTNLKNLSKNIIASQEREKELVARELHDHLGQVLTALRIDAIWLKNHLAETVADAADRAEKMSFLIDKTIQDVRDMSYRLRPRVLDDLGLADALESLVSDFEKRSNVSCVFRQDPIPEIDKTLATALYRIGQEAVTNAIRHAEATTINVELRTDVYGLVLTVQDNGIGFDPAKSTRQTGFGLEGMMERANLAGGWLDITSATGCGTCITCKVKVKG